MFRRRARRADESRPSDVSFRVFVGSRYSFGGIVFCRRQLPSLCRVALFARRARRANESLLLLVAAPEYSGVLTATVFLSSSEEVLDSGLPLVDADDFVNVNLSAAAPEYSGVLTAPIVVFVRGGARLGSSACAINAPDGSSVESTQETGLDAADTKSTRRRTRQRYSTLWMVSL